MFKCQLIQHLSIYWTRLVNIYLQTHSCLTWFYIRSFDFQTFYFMLEDVEQGSYLSRRLSPTTNALFRNAMPLALYNYSHVDF